MKSGFKNGCSVPALYFKDPAQNKSKIRGRGVICNPRPQHWRVPICLIEFIEISQKYVTNESFLNI